MAHSEREAAYHESCIRGYHIYQEVWMAAVGEVIFYEREPHNSHDCYQYWLEQLLAKESTATRVLWD